MWWCSSSVPENNHMHRWITEREAETGRRDWNGSKYLEGTLSWWIAKRWYLDVLGDAAFSHFCFVGLFLLLLFYFCSCFWYVCWPKFNVWLNDWMIEWLNDSLHRHTHKHTFHSLFICRSCWHISQFDCQLSICFCSALWWKVAAIVAIAKSQRQQQPMTSNSRCCN